MNPKLRLATQRVGVVTRVGHDGRRASFLETEVMLPLVAAMRVVTNGGEIRRAIL